MERAGWKKKKQKTLQITFSLNFLDGALTCLSRAASLGLPASVLPFPHSVCLRYLLALTLQTGQTFWSANYWGKFESPTNLCLLV